METVKECLRNIVRDDSIVGKLNPANMKKKFNISVRCSGSKDSSSDHSHHF
jgi:hypothetical protein